MQAIGSWLKKRHQVTMIWAISAIMLFSILVTWVMLACTPHSPAIIGWLILRSCYLMPVLNWLPIFLFMLLFYFLTSNATFSISTIAYLMLVMAITNRVKIELRGDPLLHWDLGLIVEAVAIIKGFGTLPIALGVAFSILYIVLAVFLAHHFPSARLPLKMRGLGALGCLAAMLLCNATLYSSSKIEKKLPVWGSFYNQADVHNSRGNLYEFIYTLNTTKTSKPADYDTAGTRAFIEQYEKAHETGVATAQRPNVIMIMGEAFSAISESETVDFTGHRDPLEHFKALGADGVSGTVVVPSRGGGTANTEFDVLTARAARTLRNVPYAYRTIIRPVDAIPSLLASIGYDTFALHPGYRWFYNRQNVYQSLGFSTSVFEDAFPSEAYRDAFISEEATFDKLLELIDARLDDPNGTPLFGFCLTIQNHAAYQDRFLPEGVVNFNSDAPLTDAEKNILSNYFAGIAEADDHLARLTTYLDQQEEPFVILYYGDHLPSLDEGLYDLLIPGADDADGSFRKETRLYSIPFIVWQNEAAKASTDVATRMQQADADMPDNMTITSNYLGAYLLELLGFDGLSGYFDLANEVRADYPVLMDETVFTRDGQPLADEQDSDMLDAYLHWMYYALQEA